ncbi:MAG: hypothetical protein V7K48_12885 [Nostoc sp.]|uniref:hypothetical protein n=1 Tax=Nostoc sp. TaxID=1180 RepID=UPI002FF85375
MIGDKQTYLSRKLEPCKLQTYLEQEDKYNQDLIKRLDIHVNEAGRNKTSEKAKLVVNYLKTANLSFLQHANHTEKRFYIALNELFTKV